MIREIKRKARAIEKRLRVSAKVKRDLSRLDLSSYLKDIAYAFDTSAPLPSFLRSDSQPLTVNIPEENKISALRLELTSTNCLNLHSIALYNAKGSRLASDKITRVVASSHYGNSAGHIENGHLFNIDGKHCWSVHTLKEDKPWLMIILDKPRAVKELLIRNRQDYFAYRTAGMIISVLDSRETWIELHQVEDIEFRKKAKEIYKKYNLNTYRYGKSLHELTLCIMYKATKHAETILERLPLSLQHKLRQEINRKLLYPRSLEWTVHGTKRSFRFWSDEEKRSYLDFASSVINDLKDLSEDVSFGFGTVLAAVRDKDMIPHDDDIDTIIAFRRNEASSLGSAKNLVRNHLEKRGYKVNKEFFSHLHVSNEKYTIDVFVSIYGKDESIGWYPGPRHGLVRSDLFPTKDVTLFGLQCPIPKRTSRYLNVVYGKEWHTPNPSHSHNWSTESYADLVD